MTFPDTDIKNAPDYLQDYVAKPKQDSVAELLFDGSWRGHGEELFRVFDIVQNDCSIFSFQLPDTESEESFPTAIKVHSTTTNKSFLVYNSRQHPASWHSMEENAKKETIYSDKYCCLKCGETKFRISIGLEVPSDSDANNDTSWFTLATECVNCGDRAITFEDETA